VNATPADSLSAPAKTAADPAAEVARAVDQPVPEAPRDTPAGSRPLPAFPSAAADAIRNSEPIQPDAPVRASGAVQEITVRIAQPDTPVVDVHVLQRGEQVQVDVRTPDASIQTTLREDLGTLVNSLQRAGYRAEAFTPQQSAELRMSSSEMNSSEDRDRGEPHSGDTGSGGPSDRQQQQKQRDQRSQAWFEELEKQA
jgi:hypothetical protein